VDDDKNFTASFCHDCDEKAHFETITWVLFELKIQVKPVESVTGPLDHQETT